MTRAPKTLPSNRLFHALFGALLVPVSYLIYSELGYSRLKAFLRYTAICFLSDSALITGSRVILIDSIDLCLLLLYNCTRFSQFSASLGSHISHVWHTSHSKYGLLTVCSWSRPLAQTSCRWKRIHCWFLVNWVVYVVRPYWRTIDDLSVMPCEDIIYGSTGRSVSLWCFCVPVGVYVATFYVHFLVLNTAGPYAATISTASLEVNSKFCIHSTRSALTVIDVIGWIVSHHPRTGIRYRSWVPEHIEECSGSNWRSVLTTFARYDKSSLFVILTLEEASVSP